MSVAVISVAEMSVAAVKNRIGDMGRWEPDARGRLFKVTLALELYGERGYGQTTVAEIAGRAGLTERTFFRHFADKREVLFAGAGALEDLLVSTVAKAPDCLAPIEVAAAGIEAAGAAIQEGGELPRQRQAIIAASAELQERELIKLATLASALAGALRGRGVDTSPPPAWPLEARYRGLQDRFRTLDQRDRAARPATELIHRRRSRS